jgi:hypothetical protein
MITFPRPPRDSGDLLSVWRPDGDGRPAAAAVEDSPEHRLFAAAVDVAIQREEIWPIVDENTGVRPDLEATLRSAADDQAERLFGEGIVDYNRLVRLYAKATGASVDEDAAHEAAPRSTVSVTPERFAVNGLVGASVALSVVGLWSLVTAFVGALAGLAPWYVHPPWISSGAALGLLGILAGASGIFLGTRGTDLAGGRIAAGLVLRSGLALSVALGIGGAAAVLSGVLGGIGASSPWLAVHRWMPDSVIAGAGGVATGLAILAVAYLWFAEVGLKTELGHARAADVPAAGCALSVGGASALLVGGLAAAVVATPWVDAPRWLAPALIGGLACGVIGVVTMVLGPPVDWDNRSSTPTLQLISAALAGYVVWLAVHRGGTSGVVAPGIGFIAGGIVYGVWSARWPAAVAQIDSRGVSRLSDGPVLTNLRQAVDDWVENLADHVLVPFLRVRLNAILVEPFEWHLNIRDVSGLRETQNPDHHIPTETLSQLLVLFSHMDAGSIGIAGPRGVGKSTLIRLTSFEHGRRGGPRPGRAGAVRTGVGLGSLTVVVSAPVEYTARDFVLHLFDELCSSYLTYRGAPDVAPRPRRLRWAVSMAFGTAWTLLPAGGGGMLIAKRQQASTWLLNWFYQRRLPPNVLLWRPALTSWLPTGLAGLGVVLVLYAINHGRRRRWVWWWRQRNASREEPLVSKARKHLSRIRFLQTYTTGWSGGVKTPIAVEAQVSGSLAAVQQALTFPEIVGSFRTFLTEVASEILVEGNAVFVGIDELDKIESAERARQFLDDVKGVFDVQNVYFLVSVSEDALVSFERRGISVRDAFDSAFDEIVRADYLDLATARKLLERRVVGLTVPFVAFCYALSGGLPRDLIRITRRVVSAADLVGRTDLTTISRYVLKRELEGKIAAARSLLPRDCGQDPAVSTLLSDLDDLTALREQPDFLRAAASRLQKADATALSADSRNARALLLRAEIRTYACFCATLFEIFSKPVDAVHIEAAMNATGSDSFAALARARQGFELNSYFAQVLIDKARTGWRLTR